MQISNLRIGRYSYKEYRYYNIPPSLRWNFSGVNSDQMIILAREEIIGGQKTISVYVPVQLRSTKTGNITHLGYNTESEFARLGYKKLCSIPHSKFSFKDYTDGALLNYVDWFLLKYTQEGGG
jgi:hypothetical protein